MSAPEEHPEVRPTDRGRGDLAVRQASFERVLVLLLVFVPTILVLGRLGVWVSLGPITETLSLATAAVLLGVLVASRRGLAVSAAVQVPVFGIGGVLYLATAVETALRTPRGGADLYLGMLQSIFLVIVGAGYLALPRREARLAAVGAALAGTIGLLAALPVHGADLLPAVPFALLAAIVVRLVDTHAEAATVLASTEATARAEARLALLDQLTELPNRRALVRELEDARRPGLLLVDVDRFKQVNDRHGHDVGDLALVAVARAIRDTCREDEVAGRWGGEEFLVLLDRGADVDAAGERVRRAVAASSSPVPLTVSVGAVAGGGASWEQSLRRADAALYAAKNDGRNCVVVAGDDHDGDAATDGRHASSTRAAGPDDDPGPPADGRPRPATERAQGRTL